jgi:hypothetical protein
MVLTSVIAVFLAAADAQPIEMVAAGGIWASDVPENPEGEWLALCSRGARYSLVAGSWERTVEPMPGGRGLVQGTHSACAEPLLLVRGGGLKTRRRVATAKLGSVRGTFSPSRERADIADPFTFGRQRGVMMHRRIGEEGGFALDLQLGGVSQRLSEVSNSDDGSVRVNWAGDLDGDGRLDVIVSTHLGKGAGEDSLYLSTLAKPGELVGLAAQFDGSGC